MASSFLAPLKGTWVPVYYWSLEILNGSYHLTIEFQDLEEPSAFWAILINIYGHFYSLLLTIGMARTWLPKLDNLLTKRALTEVSFKLGIPSKELIKVMEQAVGGKS